MVGTEKPCWCHINEAHNPESRFPTVLTIIYCSLHAAAPALPEACKAAIPLVDTCPNAQYAACDCMRCEVANKIASAVSSTGERQTLEESCGFRKAEITHRGAEGEMTMGALERQQDILLGRIVALESEITHLRARWYKLLDLCEEFASLADDAEAIPYPLKVRFRRACQAAEAAIAAVKEDK